MKTYSASQNAFKAPFETINPMTSNSNTLGIIGSSGGSALIAADNCLKTSGIVQPLVVVTDRTCGMEGWARKNAREFWMIEDADTHSFSRKACRVFSDAGVSRVLLFFSRRVEHEIFEELEVSNIHPSLLPEFPGLHALKRSFRGGSLVVGATLHRVEEVIDAGRVTNQIGTKISEATTLREAERISFAQKVWLTLAWQQNLAPYAERLPGKLSESFAAFGRSVGLEAFSSSGAE